MSWWLHVTQLHLDHVTKPVKVSKFIGSTELQLQRATTNNSNSNDNVHNRGGQAGDMFQALGMLFLFAVLIIIITSYVYTKTTMVTTTNTTNTTQSQQQQQWMTTNTTFQLHSLHRCYIEFHPEHSLMFSGVLCSHVTLFHTFHPSSPFRNINTLQSPQPFHRIPMSAPHSSYQSQTYYAWAITEPSRNLSGSHRMASEVSRIHLGTFTISIMHQH